MAEQLRVPADLATVLGTKHTPVELVAEDGTVLDRI
jgi:hypothetical protein